MATKMLARKSGKRVLGEVQNLTSNPKSEQMAVSGKAWLLQLTSVCWIIWENQIYFMSAVIWSIANTNELVVQCFVESS